MMARATIGAMHTYLARVLWQRGESEAFTDNRYSRRHRLLFDGGAEWAGSASPQVVPPPLSDASAVDPEEAFVASLASCHMLWFLSLAARQGYRVDRYDDEAAGVMALDAQGRLAMTVVTLRPRVVMGGSNQPTPTQLAQLHHEAHESCYIARSVKTEVRCEPRT